MESHGAGFAPLSQTRIDPIVSVPDSFVYNHVGRPETDVRVVLALDKEDGVPRGPHTGHDYLAIVSVTSESHPLKAIGIVSLQNEQRCLDGTWGDPIDLERGDVHCNFRPLHHHPDVVNVADVGPGTRSVSS